MPPRQLSAAPLRLWLGALLLAVCTTAIARIQEPDLVGEYRRDAMLDDTIFITGFPGLKLTLSADHIFHAEISGSEPSTSNPTRPSPVTPADLRSSEGSCFTFHRATAATALVRPTAATTARSAQTCAAPPSTKSSTPLT